MDHLLHFSLVNKSVWYCAACVTPFGIGAIVATVRLRICGANQPDFQRGINRSRQPSSTGSRGGRWT